jgi:hypothetical protein
MLQVCEVRGDEVLVVALRGVCLLRTVESVVAHLDALLEDIAGKAGR